MYGIQGSINAMSVDPGYSSHFLDALRIYYLNEHTRSTNAGPITYTLFVV